jgi:hypothetical protein
MRKHEIREPYPSDFENQDNLLGKKDKPKKFDFLEVPQSPLSVSRYFHYKGQDWQGPEAAIEYLRKEYKKIVAIEDKTDQNVQEMEWIVKMGKILKGEDEKPIPPATIKQTDRWLGRMIEDKSADVLDAQRQSDTEMAKSFETQKRQLEELLNNIKQGNWDSINIDDPIAPLNACITETKDYYKFQKDQNHKKQIEEAKKKLDALLRIKSLIEKNQ